jgi:hypothetical protein
MVLVTIGLFLSLSTLVAAGGGPDAYGYVFRDSSDPDGPTFLPQDISGTGTPISLSDDWVSGNIPIGFTFNFYGTDYTDVRVSSNGFLIVPPGSEDGCCVGDPIPTNTPPNGVIAGWWEDLSTEQGGTIHYQTLGAAPNRTFIVQFTNVAHMHPSVDDYNPVTMWFKLFEGSNNIEVHYEAAPTGDSGTHSAGIENQDGTIGLQYYLGDGPLTTPVAVLYRAPPVPKSVGGATFTMGLSSVLFVLIGAVALCGLGLLGGSWAVSRRAS